MYLEIYISPKEMKTGYWRDIWTPMFIAALFTIAKLQKQPKCASMDEWIKKIWGIYLYISMYLCIYLHIYIIYIYLVIYKYNSAMRKKEILPLATTWMEFEGIMLNEISQTEKDKILHCIAYVWNL